MIRFAPALTLKTNVASVEVLIMSVLDDHLYCPMTFSGAYASEHRGVLAILKNKTDGDGWSKDLRVIQEDCAEEMARGPVAIGVRLAAVDDWFV